MAVRDPLVAHPVGDQLTAPGAAAPTAEVILGHAFARPELLREALTHRSAAQGSRGATRPGGRVGRQKGAGSNERLEFVGDRVLGLLIAEWLAERFPDEQEGELGRRLAHLVSQPVLAAIAGDTGLPAVLSVAPGESRAGVRKRATVLADAMEATIGAMFIDGGLEPARRFVRRAWESAMTAQSAPPKDSKTALQEWAQGRGLALPEYLVASREGPPHAPVFVITVTVEAKTGTGTAGTKRAAEQDAAADLLGKLGT
jgi:ribonuclease III